MTVPLFTPSASALGLGRLALDAVAMGRERLAHFEAKLAAGQAAKELETVRRGIVPDGFFPDGQSRPWRKVVVLSRSGRMVRVRYDDGTEGSVTASAVYSGDATGGKAPRELFP